MRTVLVLLSALVDVLVGGCRMSTGPDLAQFSYLHVIPTEDATRRGEPDSLLAEIEVADARGLADQLDPALVTQVEAERLVVDLARYPGGRPTRREDYLAATFVVDYDEPRFVEWARPILAEGAGAADLARLVDAVRTAIEPGLGNDSLSASEVLERGKGDCTEHAVLFAALARSAAIPTRIIHGTVLVVLDGGGLQAFGHAWNEIQRADGAWALLDATPIQGARPIAYLPRGVAEDEGPGYGYSMIEAFARTPRRVRVIDRDDGDSGDVEVRSSDR